MSQIVHNLNVQIFASTHSCDCIAAFQSTTQGDTQDTSMHFRLANKKHGIEAMLFVYGLMKAIMWILRM
jgi:predicted ATP-dependent endonuclease of OLD family